MPLFIVTVRETTGRHREYEARVRADHAAAAVGRAVRKLFGARAALRQDHGLPAGRVAVDVAPVRLNFAFDGRWRRGWGRGGAS